MALATVVAVVLCVLVHYEGLSGTQKLLARVDLGQRRTKVLYGIFAVLVLHVVEIWIFGLTIWFLVQWPETGSLGGDATGHLFECVYLSAASFSTVGFGDVYPKGAIRFLAGTEALVGLVMITWSASFTYLEMERFWRR